MLKRHRKRILLSTVLIVLVIAAMAYLFATRPYRALDTIAVKFPLPSNVKWYDWLNDTEILLSVFDSLSDKTSVKLRNIKSGREQNLTTVTQKIASLNVDRIESLSPDHKWLLCAGSVRGDWLYYGISLQQSPQFVFEHEGALAGTWYADSSRWVADNGLGTLTEFFSFNARKEQPLHSIEVSQDMNMPHLLSFTPTGAAVIGDFCPADNVDKVVLSQYQFDTAKKIRQDTIVFPTSAAVECVEMEPQGERILWQLRVDLNASHPSWLRQMMASLHHPFVDRYATLFWICRLDGREGQILGYIDAQAIYDLRWLPSKTTFSFRIWDDVNNELWVVPVPK